VKVLLKIKDFEETISVQDAEAIDPIGLPGFLSIIQHDIDNPDVHTSYIWPAMSIEHMVVETVEGEKFEHTNTPHWFKSV